MSAQRRLKSDRYLTTVFVVRMKNFCSLGYPKCVQWRFWSDCANAQAGLNLYWVRMSEDTISDVAAHFDYALK